MATGLRIYIIGCGLIAACLALVPVAIWPRRLEDIQWLPASILVVMCVLAIRFPLVWHFNVEVFVLAVPLSALVLTVPLVAVGPLVAVAAVIGYLIVPRRPDFDETLFNVSQVVIYSVMAAAVYAVAQMFTWLGPQLATLGSWGAVILTLVVLYLANYGLVAGAASLQMGASFPGVWRAYLTRDIVTEATQLGLGVISAIIATVEPLILPVLVVPVALISVSTRRAMQLQTDTQDALTRMVELLELRDAYTAGHSHRVAEISRALAVRLGMAPDEVDIVRSAGEVHDIGKIIIDPAVLHKTGRLTDAEFEVIKQHPVHGGSIVSRFASYGDGYLMVRHHHERLDGRGYPDGLTGDEIPIGARIIAVADSYDAMTSARSYRDAMSPEQVVSILVEGAGEQWDPEVVAAMLDYLGVDPSAIHSAKRRVVESPRAAAVPTPTFDDEPSAEGSKPEQEALAGAASRSVPAGRQV